MNYEIIVNTSLVINIFLIKKMHLNIKKKFYYNLINLIVDDAFISKTGL